MKSDIWHDGIRRRRYMGCTLTHLTRSTENLSGMDVLINILKDKKLKGSSTETGFIVGNKKAVCFQETPINLIAENVVYDIEMEKKNRCEQYGICFLKNYVYSKGGRPVIYDKTQEAKNYLPKDEWWRIVNLDLSDLDNIIDWTHEREWRIAEELNFELHDISIIVGDYTERDELIERCKKENIDLTQVRSIIVLIDCLV